MHVGFEREAHQFLLDAGYNAANVVKSYRFAWRNAEGGLSGQSAGIVAFSSAPHNMRTACVGVMDADESTAAQLLDRFRFLTTPLLIARHKGSVYLYSVRKTVDATPLLEAPQSDWMEKFASRMREIRPESLLSAKRDEIQLPFVDSALSPWAETITERTLTTLLESTIAGALSRVPRSRRASPAVQRQVVRLVIQLFAARVLEDQQIIEVSDHASEALEQAASRFGSSFDPTIVASARYGRNVANFTFEVLRSRFTLTSVTPEMIGHAYENALVTGPVRRELGIYYTPRSLADYVLDRLPVEALSLDDRLLLDPCCGSGSFLGAGYRRLSSLLPKDWSADQRHDYLRRRIVGSDVDGFAREIAVLAMIIGDLHNHDGWRILDRNVHDVTRRQLGFGPNIIVTNPPFREVKQKGQRRETGAEILLKLLRLLAPGGLMGVVLPQSVLESRAGREARAAVLDTGELLEVDTLPGGLFASNADTAVLLLRKKSDGRRASVGVASTMVRELHSRDLPGFRRAWRFSHSYLVDPASWSEDPERRFLMSPLVQLWKKIEDSCATLGEVADVRAGIRVKHSDRSSVADKRRSGNVPYVERLDVLRPFALLTTHDVRPLRWLRYGDQLDRARDPKIFAPAKVLLNSNRNPASPWRFVAAIAPEGLFFSHNFHGVIPLDTTLEAVVAVLNGPVANAWFHGRCRKRWVVLKTLKELPFPHFDPEALELLASRVSALERAVVARVKKAEEGLFYDGFVDSEEAARLRSEIDQLVFDAYGLTSGERGDVLKIMRHEARPA